MSRSRNSKSDNTYKHPCWHCENKDCPHTPVRDARRIGYGKVKRWNWRAERITDES